MRCIPLIEPDDPAAGVVGGDGKMDLLTVGDICIDLIVTGNVRPKFGQVEQLVDDCSLELGGSGAIFASQAAKLGLSTAIVGWIGRDSFGEMVLDGLGDAGVVRSHLRRHASLKTGIGIALSEGNDRAILTYMGTIDALRPSDLEPSMLDSVRHFHLASYFLLESMHSFWPAWFGQCRERGVTVSLDTNWDPRNAWKGVRDLLPLVDVFLPNENEALAVSGEASVGTALRVLTAYGPLVVIKRGELGALVGGPEGTLVFTPDEATGLPRRIVDTTGAGDNFDAGFLCAWLSRRDRWSCCAAGHRCAVGSLEFAGGTRGQSREMPALQGEG